jgi:hypothetical protein
MMMGTGCLCLHTARHSRATASISIFPGILVSKTLVNDDGDRMPLSPHGKIQPGNSQHIYLSRNFGIKDFWGIPAFLREKADAVRESNR